MATRTPVIDTIIIGRISDDDWHVTLSGHAELDLGDGTVERLGLRDISLNYSQIASDMRAGCGAMDLRNVCLRLLSGELVPSQVDQVDQVEEAVND